MSDVIEAAVEGLEATTPTHDVEPRMVVGPAGSDQLKGIYRGHEITIESEHVGMQGERLIYWIRRVDDGMLCDSDNEESERTAVELYGVLKGMIDSELEFGGNWEGIAPNSDAPEGEGVVVTTVESDGSESVSGIHRGHEITISTAPSEMLGDCLVYRIVRCSDQSDWKTGHGDGEESVAELFESLKVEIDTAIAEGLTYEGPGPESDESNDTPAPMDAETEENEWLRRERPLVAKHTENQTLVTELTESRREHLAAELAVSYQDLEALKAKKKAIDTVYNGQIKDRENDCSKLAKTLNEGREGTTVRCQWFFDYTVGVKYLIRDDNGETVQTKSMTLAEKQLKLDEFNGAAVECPAPIEPEPVPMEMKCNGCEWLWTLAPGQTAMCPNCQSHAVSEIGPAVLEHDDDDEDWGEEDEEEASEDATPETEAPETEAIEIETIAVETEEIPAPAAKRGRPRKKEIEVTITEDDE